VARYELQIGPEREDDAPKGFDFLMERMKEDELHAEI
jgi:hypothetical protein